MKLFVLTCLIPFALHSALCNPTPPSQLGISQNPDGMDDTTPSSSHNSTGGEGGLEKLAKSTRFSKEELQKIRKSLDRLGELATKQNEEVMKRKGHKEHMKLNFDKDSSRLHRNHPIEINQRLGIDKYLFDGDMLLSSEDIEQRMREAVNNDNATRAKRQILLSSAIWTMPIPYYFDSSVPDNTKTAFRNAVALYQSKTCLSFTESSTAITSQPAIQVTYGVGCHCTIGAASPTVMSLGDGCDTTNVAAHELMHALGWEHHQSRSDRNTYITVDMSQVDPASAGNFYLCGSTECDNQGLNYDFNSNMHYPGTFFPAAPGDITMTAVDPLYVTSVGGVVGVTYGDLLAINTRYNCASRCSSGATCSNGGYRNPANCNACNCKATFNENNGCVGLSTSDSCGQSVTATSTWQTLSGQVTMSVSGSVSSGDPASFCDYQITAPAGQLIQIQIISAGTNCEPSCMWGGIEFFMLMSTTSSGFRYCCTAQTSSQPIYTSDSPIVRIRPYSRLSTQTFQIQYKTIASTSAPPTVTVYDGASYAGASKTYTLTDYTCNDDLAYNFNDIVSSLQITSGCVELFGAKDCIGGSKQYTANTPSLVADGLDNSASSLRQCSLITLFADPNYGGATKTYTITGSCNSDVASSFNDITSSIQLTSGCVELYGASGCIGGSKQYTANTTSLVADGLDNTISSLRACSSVSFYVDPNYGGVSHTYTITGACNSVLASSFNDQISSLQVTGCVEVFADSNCAGISYQYTANTATMTSDIDNNASSFRACSSVSFYVDPNYGGVSHTFTVSNTCNSGIASTFNDQISSLQVTGCVEVFSDSGCSGISKQYTANTATMTSDIDNNASSFSSCNA